MSPFGIERGLLKKRCLAMIARKELTPPRVNASCRCAMSEDKPAVLCVYDIPLPRERSSTFPTVDYHLWKARHKLLGEHDSDLGTMRPVSSEANSQTGSWETLSDCGNFPAALCAYDIPLPCGHFRSWEEVCDVAHVNGDEAPPVSRKRSMTMPATDLKKIREKTLEKKLLRTVLKVGGSR